MSCVRPTKFAHVVYRTRRFEADAELVSVRIRCKRPVSKPGDCIPDLRRRAPPICVCRLCRCCQPNTTEMIVVA